MCSSTYRVPTCQACSQNIAARRTQKRTSQSVWLRLILTHCHRIGAGVIHKSSRCTCIESTGPPAMGQQALAAVFASLPPALLLLQSPCTSSRLLARKIACCRSPRAAASYVVSRYMSRRSSLQCCGWYSECCHTMRPQHNLLGHK